MEALQFCSKNNAVVQLPLIKGVQFPETILEPRIQPLVNGMGFLIDFYLSCVGLGAAGDLDARPAGGRNVQPGTYAHTGQ
jgi:hypothetical protein